MHIPLRLTMHQAVVILTTCIQIFGILFLNWTIAQVLLIYVFQMVLAGTSAIIMIFFFPIKSKSITKTIVSFLGKLYFAGVFTMTYGFMLGIGSLIIFWLTNFNLDNLFANPLSTLHSYNLVGIFSYLAIITIVQLFQILTKIKENQDNATQKVLSCYIELGVFLVILLVFFYVGKLFNISANELFWRGRQNNDLSFAQNWFALSFISIQLLSEMFLKNSVAKRFAPQPKKPRLRPNV